MQRESLLRVLLWQAATKGGATTFTAEPTAQHASVELLWLPLGAGAHIVRLSGRVFEALSAWRDHRPRCDLYHSALVVHTPEGRYAIEQTPALGNPDGDDGVVAQGAVMFGPAGRLRMFRYQVRCTLGGVIPDAAYAVGGPVCLSEDAEVARRVVAAVRGIPTPVWGRDQLGGGEMWNCNSIIAWVLCTAGIDAAHLRPPAGGRAPGWSAGVTVACCGA